MSVLNIIEAVNSALKEVMTKDDNVIVLGEDVGVNGGVFRATQGLLEHFGHDRVIDTPLSENGIIASAVGMSVFGLKPVAEIQFMGFIYYIINHIICHAARLRSRTGGRLTAPLVVRAPYGAGIRAPEHHSESTEVFFTHIPGIKVVVPSTPGDAKGLLISSIEDPDPVIFLEPKRVYRAIKEDVPDAYYTVPLSKARIVKEGKDITVICWGAMVREVEAASKEAADMGVDLEIVDLRTLSPIDRDTIEASVKKTGRALIVHEAPKTCGLGAELVAIINEKAFLHLKAPVLRVTGQDVPVPMPKFEDYYLPSLSRIVRGVRKVMDY